MPNRNYATSSDVERICFTSYEVQRYKDVESLIEAAWKQWKGSTCPEWLQLVGVRRDSSLPLTDHVLEAELGQSFWAYVLCVVTGWQVDLIGWCTRDALQYGVRGEWCRRSGSDLRVMREFGECERWLEGL